MHFFSYDLFHLRELLDLLYFNGCMNNELRYVSIVIIAVISICFRQEDYYS